MNVAGFMKDAVILFAITLIAGAGLGSVYEITKEPIAQARQEAKDQACKIVLPEAATFEVVKDASFLETVNGSITEMGFGNVIVDECLAGLDGNGQPVGYVITATSKDGYAGGIQVSAGIKKDGTLIGIEFLTIAETVGLGMNATLPEWKGQFAGKKVDGFAVTKSGAATDSDIDVISGATITSDAVVGAVNATVYVVNEHLEK